MKSTKTLGALIVALFFIPLLAEANQQLIAGAKKEGQVLWYTTNSPKDNQKLLNGFMKKYPFIKAQAYRAAGPQIASRFRAEERAGKHLADVVRVVNFDLEIFKQKNLLARYVSPSTKRYTASMKDPEGYWATDSYTFKLLAYNNSMISDNEAPKSWFDLMDPKWRGKMVFELVDFRLYAGWEQRLGKEKAGKLMEGLAKQKLIFRKGARQIAQLLAAGEYPMAIAYVHHVEGLKAKGAPVEWVKTLDPLVALIGAVGVSSHAPHPNAARLFVDYYLSKEGQQIVRRWGKIPAHPDVDALFPSVKPKKLKIYPVDAALMLKKTQYYKGIARKVFSQ